MSLRSQAYVETKWFDAELQGVFARSRQWVCHVEKLTEPGSYVSASVAAMPIAVVRDRSGQLRAFYNVCKHRAHELLSGSGTTRNIVCPYHARIYDIRITWKNVIDNFLECYHCHIAHKEFVDLAHRLLAATHATHAGDRGAVEPGSQPG